MQCSFDCNSRDSFVVQLKRKINVLFIWNVNVLNKDIMFAVEKKS